MTDNNQPKNMRERFRAAFNRAAQWNRHERAIEKGHNGTVQDFKDRFETVADGLEAALEAFIVEVDNGRTNISGFGDVYKHFGEPLKYEFVIPSVCNRQEEEYLEKNVFYLRGYRRIHEICSREDIDMHVRTAWRSTGYHTSSGELKSYSSILVEICPETPYQAHKDYKPLPPSSGLKSPGQGGSAD